MNQAPAKKSIDCIGLFCPQPLFQTRMALDKMEPGEILEILTDDPSAESDFKAFSQKTGNELVRIEREGTILKIFIKKTIVQK